jgi:uncharacterized membrane protein
MESQIREIKLPLALVAHLHNETFSKHLRSFFFGVKFSLVVDSYELLLLRRSVMMLILSRREVQSIRYTYK